MSYFTKNVFVAYCFYLNQTKNFNTKKMTKKLILIACSLFVAQISQAQGDKTAKTLPANVQLKDLTGKAVGSEELGKSGKITVVSFWATWCTPCKKELNNIAEFYEEWQKEYDLQVVAVSIDDAQTASKVATYTNASAWKFRVLLDANQDLKRALNVQSVPYTLLLNQAGQVVYTHEGYVEGDEYALEDQIRKLTKK